MSSSLPDGFSVREAGREDIGAAAAIVRAEEQALRGDSTWAPEDMSDFWRYVNFDGCALAVERNGAPVAFAAGVERDDWTNCWVSVHPEVRGRGLAAWLLRWVERRARDIGKRQAKVGAFAEDMAFRKLFEAHGFHDARHFYEMRIDLDNEPDPPEWPSGIEPDRFRPEDAPAFHAAVHEAFQDDWGFVAVPFEEWKRTRLGAPDTDTSLWFVARTDGEIAGFARCDAGRHGGGWIGALGVRAPWRKRGIGLALLREALCEFHRRGEPHVGLATDAANPTGSTRLYERAGMRVIKEDVVYEKDLT
jgi:ribosomal protein S18 acetylase RimI-like enzyme